MRLPLTKVYRAFKELDEFSDAQCAGYVHRARTKRFGSMVITAAAAVPCCLVIVGVGFVLAVSTAESILNTGARPWLMRWYLDVVIEAMAAIIPPIAAIVGALIARDIWLRHAIRKELVRSTCPACEYQLLGLPAMDGMIRCPECGNQTRVEMLGLNPHDLAMLKHVQQPAHPPLASPIRR